MPTDEQATAVLGNTTDVKRQLSDIEATEGALPWLNDVYRYALGRLGSREDAEDAVMEAFLAVHGAPARWRKARDRRLYLFGITARKVADVLRKRRKLRAIPAGLTHERLDLDRAGVIEAVLGVLPQSQREVLILKYLHEFSVQEIAQIVRKSPQAVNSLLQRAREGFRAEAGEGFEEGMSR